MDGILRCEWCCTPSERLGSGKCRTCGGPVRILGVTVLECGWCGSSNRRDEIADCQNCGGPLPDLPGGSLGKPPPLYPRTLPEGYRERALKFSWTWGDFCFALGYGVVFAGMVLLREDPEIGWRASTLSFFFYALICLLMAVLGVHKVVERWKMARLKLETLVDGLPTVGKLIDVYQHVDVEIAGRRPWIMRYKYDTEFGEEFGMNEGWDPIHERRKVGDIVRIVHIPYKKYASAIWPPLH